MNLILNVKNCVATENDKIIDCEIEHINFGWLPFSAYIDDVEPIGREIYNDIINGTYGEIKPYVEPIIEAEIMDESIEL